MNFKLVIEHILTSKPISLFIKKFISINLNNIKINYSKISPKTSARIFFGLYERAETKLIKKYIINYNNVLEIGGGIGITAKYCTYFNKNIKNYYIIEPYSLNLKVIESQRFDCEKLKLFQGCVTNNEEDLKYLEFSYTNPILNKFDKSKISPENMS